MRTFTTSILGCLALVGVACSDGSEIYSSVASQLGSGGDDSTATTVGTGGDVGHPTTSGSAGSGVMAGTGGDQSTGPGAGGNGTGGSGTGGNGTGGGMTVDAGMVKTDGGGLIGTPFKLLVFTKAVAFVHDSIPICVTMLKGMAAANNFTVTETADAGAFTDANLAQYAEVFFVSTTGGIFSDAGAVGVTAKAAFQKYMENGGGYAGVHAATDCERDGRWTWYEDFMGALWNGVHDTDGTAGTVILQPVDNPAVRGLTVNWIRPNGEEWYHQTRDPAGRPGITILAKLSSDQRPVSWIHELPGGGRMFYTIQGHNKTYYDEPELKAHILGGLLWAAKRAN